MHVLCITPNVSIDRTLEVPGFTAGGVWRAASVTARCGGKGVNVARAVVALGHRARCAGLLGGHMGRLAAETAAAEGLEARWTWTHSETRTCVIIVGSNGAASVINEPGSSITASDWDLFVTDVASAAADVNAVAISGSVPPGTPEGGLRELIERVGRKERRVWVDCGGTILADLLAGEPPRGLAGIKINAEEAASVVGGPIDTAGTAMMAAETIRQRGAGTVVITMGAAGAVLLGDGTGLYARPPAIAAVNAVGSGDCFLAGLMAGWDERRSWEDALLLATAAGAANALSSTVGFSNTDVARLIVEITLNPLAALG